MTKDEKRQAVLDAIVEDILNEKDGAGSDLQVACIEEEGVWLYVQGNLDVSALTNTIMRQFEGWVE